MIKRMDFLKCHYNVLSVVLFVIVIIVAHLISPNNYDWTKNTISDLGSQGYEWKIIMQFGFLAFGITLVIGILLNGLTWRTTPVLIYGLCIALTGFFCTKPFFSVDTFSTFQSSLHSIFAQIVGMVFSIGILTQIFFSISSREKYSHLIFFILVVGLSATFGLLKDYQGIVQRTMYIVSFIWLIRIYKS